MWRLARIVVTVGIALLSPATYAEWPERTVRFVVPGSAGSAPDIIARVVAERLSSTWGGRPVMVDPRPGGNTQIGVEAVVRAAPDGYSFLFTQAAALTISPYTLKSVPYDVERDLAPVVHVGYSPMMIAVHPGVPARDLKELVGLAKTMPGQLNYGTSSTRNVPHLTGELLNLVAGVKLVHVPYKGSAQAVQEAIGGQVPVVIDGAAPLVGPSNAGRLRPIAVTSAKRFPGMPELPAVAETYPGFDLTGWFAVMAPAGTPRAIVERLNRDINAVLAQPEVAAKLARFGVIPVGGSVEDLARTLKVERERFARVVREARIEPE